MVSIKYSRNKITGWIETLFLISGDRKTIAIMSRKNQYNPVYLKVNPELLSFDQNPFYKVSEEVQYDRVTDEKRLAEFIYGKISEKKMNNDEITSEILSVFYYLQQNR